MGPRDFWSRVMEGAPGLARPRREDGVLVCLASTGKASTEVGGVPHALGATGDWA